MHNARPGTFLGGTFLGTFLCFQQPVAGLMPVVISKECLRNYREYLYAKNR